MIFLISFIDNVKFLFRLIFASYLDIFCLILRVKV